MRKNIRRKTSHKQSSKDKRNLSTPALYSSFRFVIIAVIVIGLFSFGYVFQTSFTDPQVLGASMQNSVKNNAITWSTSQMSIKADNFYLQESGKLFLANTNDLVVNQIDSDPHFYTLSVTWNENGIQKQLFIKTTLFKLTKWGFTGIETKTGDYDRKYAGLKMRIARGEELTIKTFDGKAKGSGARIHFDNLRIRSFLDK